MQITLFLMAHWYINSGIPVKPNERISLHTLPEMMSLWCNDYMENSGKRSTEVGVTTPSNHQSQDNHGPKNIIHMTTGAIISGVDKKWTSIQVTQPEKRNKPYCISY